MSRQTSRRRLLALLPAGVLAGCAAPLLGPPPPRVRIVDLRPVDATMFEQRWEALLWVEEQAGTGLQVDAMTATIELNGREFGSGRSNRPFLLPARGEQEVVVPLRGSGLGLVDQLATIGRRGELKWRVEGVFLSAGRHIPYRDEGTVFSLRDTLRDSLLPF
ncbi:LEA type 2 family protein [Inquilinus limosus]|uniref:LEA type 2 family protein n=1 Tax=Inquilinus limosus TaxID=171674 RepID=UPI003F13B250